MEGESVDGGGTPMEENDSTISADDFITGVIEGFYNRPWTRFSFSSTLTLTYLHAFHYQQGTAPGSVHQVGEVGTQ